MIQQNESFDIDLEELKALADQYDFVLGERHFKAAYKRALKRTRKTMAARGRKLLKDAVGAKSQKAIKDRFQDFLLEKPGKERKMDELKLWFGLNPTSVGLLKGSKSRIGSKRKPRGAVFRSRILGNQTFEDAFVANLGKGKSIFARRGKKRFPVEQKKIEIDEGVSNLVLDEMSHDLVEVFFRHLETDLKARSKHGDRIKDLEEAALWRKTR